MFSNSVNAQKKDQSEKWFDQDVSEKYETYISSTGESDLRGGYDLKINDELETSLKVTIPIKDKKVQITIEDNLKTNDEFTPMFSSGRWAIDNTLGVSCGILVGAKRWAFKKDLDTLKSSKSALVGSHRFDYLESIGKLSQYTQHWLTIGVKWEAADYLTLKDSLYLGMEDPYNSQWVNGVVVSGLYRYSRVFSYRHGIMITGTLGYNLNTAGTNYRKLDKVEVYAGQIIADTSGGYISTSAPTQKGRKGELKVGVDHGPVADLHIIFRRGKPIAFDIFGALETTLSPNLSLVDITVGINTSISKNNKAAANLGIGVVVKDATTPFKDDKDRQSRLIPSVIVGVPIPDIKK